MFYLVKVRNHLITSTKHPQNPYSQSTFWFAVNPLSTGRKSRFPKIKEKFVQMSDQAQICENNDIQAKLYLPTLKLFLKIGNSWHLFKRQYNFYVTNKCEK